METNPTRTASDDRYRGLSRSTGVIGLVFVVLLFGPVVALASAGEPPLLASEAEAAAYYQNLDAGWARVTLGLLSFGMMSGLWYFVSLGFLLRRAEGDPPWRSAIATLSGGLLTAYGLVGVSTEAAASHGASISPEVAQYAFEVGSVGLANVWVAIASFCVCAGWVILESRMLAPWWGVWIVVVGVGLALARFTWTSESEIWVLPYLLFWAWVVALSVRLLLRPGLVPRTAD